MIKTFKTKISSVFGKVDDLKGIVSIEDQKFVDSLEEVVLTKEDIEKQEKDGMLELKKEIHLVEVKYSFDLPEYVMMDQDFFLISFNLHFKGK